VEPLSSSQARKVLKLQENKQTQTGHELVEIPDIPTRLRDGFKSGLDTAWRLIIWVLPLYVVVDLLKGSPLLTTLGEFCAPFMTLFGLPGEAAFAFVAAFLVNLYAAIAIMVPLDLTPWQVTQCGLMMGIAHNLLLEGAILRSTGVSSWVITLCRLAIAALAGLLLHVAHLLGFG
jgi:spore maturation protein SpmB